MSNLKVQNEEGQLMSVNIVITHKNKKPAIELRSLTTNPYLIRTLLSCAYRGIPAVLMPSFTNPISSLNTAIDKGIIYKAPAVACNYCNIIAPKDSVNNPCLNCGNKVYTDIEKDDYFFTSNFLNI